MEPYGFLGAWQRFERAQEHLAEVREQADAFHQELRNIGDRMFDYTEHDESRFSVRELHIPERLSIVAGELIYNLRSSLDYLVFALAWHDVGRRPKDAWAASLQYPIYSLAPMYAKLASRRLEGLSDSHVKQVERWQPFNGAAWLGELADLSNEDKHRHLLWLVGRVSMQEKWEHRWLTRGGIVVPPSDMGAYEGEELLYEDLARVEVGLDDGRPLVDTLQRLVEGVEGLLRDFAPEFKFAPLKDATGGWA